MEMEDSAKLQYDKMTKTPVPKLVLMLGFPTTVSMLVTNLYNMADTYFVSTLGTSASGATGVVFGLMAIIQAFGFMFGHGAGSNISRQLGDRHVENARKFSSTSFFLSIGSGILILALGLLFQTPLLKLLGSTDSILPYAREYSYGILIAAPAMAAGCVMNNILRYEGMAVFAMVGLTSGGILNIFGDYLLIQVFDMGVMGAGISTAVSQYVSAFILLLPFLRGKTQSRMSFRYMGSLADIKNIVYVGMPSMLRQGLNSISVMLLNQCAAPYGDAAIAAMSIVSRVINAMFCVGLGIGQGFQPVSAFNYGAKKYSWVKKACLFTLWFGGVIMLAAAVGGMLFARPVIALFRDDAEVIRIGVVAFRAQCVALAIMPVSVCGNMLFQSIGKGGQAAFLASMRSGLFFIPVLLVFSQVWGLWGIQISQMTADLLSAAVTIPMLAGFLRSLPGDGEEPDAGSFA